jgi:hypothetical protein
MALKPLKKSIRLPLLQSIQGVSLGLSAAEILLSGATVTSEGMVESSGDQEHVYCGTTFVSIDLNRSDLDVGIAEQEYPALAEASSRSILLHSRLMRLVRREVENRTAPFLPRCMSIEMQFRIEDSKLLVDISIECPLAEPVSGMDSVEEEEG